MPGYRPPNAGSLENTLARELADIKRRLTILERPTGTQKMQTTQRAIDAQADAEKALSEVATERSRNDLQWKSIDKAVADIATERGRNDTQWKSIDALSDRLGSVEGKAGNAASASEVSRLRQELVYLREWTKATVVLLNAKLGGGFNPPPGSGL